MFTIMEKNPCTYFVSMNSVMNYVAFKILNTINVQNDILL